MENVDVYIGPKPMKYDRSKAKIGRIYDILFQAQHKAGYKIVIVNYYSHPCAYIGLQEGHPYYGIDYDNIPIDCHGGLTYSDSKHTMVNELCDNGWFIGWDYNHLKDYNTYMEDFDFHSKRWTTEEIINECFNVIDQLEKLKQKALEE